MDTSSLKYLIFAWYTCTLNSHLWKNWSASIFGCRPQAAQPQKSEFLSSSSFSFSSSSRHLPQNCLFRYCSLDYNLYCISTKLALHWPCIGTALALHWHCIGTALALHWGCFGAVLSLQILPKSCRIQQNLSSNILHTFSIHSLPSILLRHLGTVKSQQKILLLIVLSHLSSNNIIF